MDNNIQNIYGKYDPKMEAPFQNQLQQNQGPFQFYNPNSAELSSQNTDNNIYGQEVFP